jgi:hypothetical protein
MSQGREDSTPNWDSARPGDPNDLPFSATEFVNACILVRDGPFEDNENWLRLVRMYERMVTLRIDPIKFCEKCFPASLLDSGVYHQFQLAKQAPTRTHPFGLPFSAQEFLTILAEYWKHETFDRMAANPLYAGSGRLFIYMVADLADWYVNLKDFLADHVPTDMEDNPLLLRLLASAQGEHTENFEINKVRFRASIYSPRNGRIVGPMSLLQAAMFAQSLQEVDPELYEPDTKQRCMVPHGDCEAVAPDEFTLIASPCCKTAQSKCCLIQTLIEDGPKCRGCGKNMVDAYRMLPRKK